MVNEATITALKKALVTKAEQLGFNAVGIAPASDDPLTVTRLHDWLDKGLHGSMTWMADRANARQGPQSLWPQARSVIVLGMCYTPGHDPLALAEMSDRARISAYAQGRDYHDTFKKTLKRLARWLVGEAGASGLGEIQLKVFVDTAPVMEKSLGQAAGLGWQGKHSNLVSRNHGSWLFLGAIYTTLELPADQPHTDRCGSCNECQIACPTQAFPKPYVLDARRCISYLTIEHDGPIPEEFRKPIGNRIYGCDDCLAVCPWNKFADAAARNRAFLPRAELAAPRLSDLLMLDDREFRSLFSASPIKRTGRNRFVRNCAIAAGNSGNATLEPQLHQLCSDSDPVVRETAGWALGQLRAIP